MSEFTTIQITKENKEKMQVLKADKNVKFDDVLTALLNDYGGALVYDVDTVNRDAVALQLRYWKFNNAGRVRSYGVTFQELKMADVGTVWVAEDNPVDVGFVNTSAELAYKDGDDNLVKVKECQVDEDGVRSCLVSFVHINTF